MNPQASRSLGLLIIAVLLAMLAPAFGVGTIATTRTRSSAQQRKADDPPLDETARKLAEESKAAIIVAGISSPYFAKHFQVVRVIDKAGDRRVVWRLFINEYETEITDAIGYYTVAGKRIDTHSVSSLLSPAREIVRTIPRARAEKLMRACIGNFQGGTVVYQVVAGQTALVFHAEAIQRRVSQREEEKQRQSEDRERVARESKRGEKPSSRDVIESEGEGDGPPIILGTINLETGKCLKGRAVSTP